MHSGENSMISDIDVLRAKYGDLVNFDDLEPLMSNSGHDTLSRCHECRRTVASRLGIPSGTRDIRTDLETQRMGELLKETIVEKSRRVRPAFEQILDTVWADGTTCESKLGFLSPFRFLRTVS
jgi:hypothetical protein